MADSANAILVNEGFVVSDGTQPDLFFGEPEYVPPGESITADTDFVITKSNSGDVIDTQVKPDDEPLNKGFGTRRRKNPSEPKTTPPNVDEWMDFFSRIVIRFLTEWYVDMIFRGIDEDIVSESDAAKLLLTQDERDTIARPFAEYANKNPFMRKHGRQIVAFADSFESVVMLGRWYTRVNRIARKYRPKKPVHTHVERMNGVNGNGYNGQSTAGTTGGTIPNGFGVYNPGSG